MPPYLAAARTAVQLGTTAYQGYQQYRSLKRGYDQISDMARRYSARKRVRRAGLRRGQGFGILKRKMMRRMTRKKNGSANAAVGFSTYQQDVKKVYKAKRKTKRSTRAYKSFLSKELKTLQPRKYHYNATRFYATSQNAQGFQLFCTYGMDGTGGLDGSGDLLDLTNRVILDNPLPTQESNQFQTRRLYFDSMSGRCNFTNTGSAVAFVEVYTCKCRRDMAVGVWGSTLDAMITNMTSSQFNPPSIGGAVGAQTTTQTAAAVSPSYNTVGVTPFQFRPFCQYFKITDVTRVMIQPNQSSYFNFRDPKKRKFEHMEDAIGLLCNKKWTTVYLFRQWGETIAGTGNATTVSASNVNYEFDKDYVVKLHEQTVPRLSYIKYSNNT